MKSKNEINQQIADNKVSESIVSSVHSGNFLSNFSLHLSNAGLAALSSIGQFVMFPFAALSSAVLAVLARKDVYLKRNKPRYLIRAILESITAMILLPLIIGLLAAVPFFVLAAPLVFAGITIIRMAVDIGQAIHYFLKSSEEKSEEKKTKYREIANSHVISAVANLLMTVAIVGLMVLNIKAFAIVGIAACVVGIGRAAYNIFNYVTKKKKEKKPIEQSISEDVPNESLLSSALTLKTINKPINKPIIEKVQSSISEVNLVRSDSEEETELSETRKIAYNILQKPVRKVRFLDKENNLIPEPTPQPIVYIHPFVG